MDGQELKAVLGRNIKNIRSQRQYTQADFAEIIDISITFLSNIERGLKFPKPDKLTQIAEGLGVEVHELFKSNSVLIVKPAVKSNNKLMLKRLSKVMTRKINSTMESVFNNFLK